MQMEGTSTGGRKKGVGMFGLVLAVVVGLGLAGSSSGRVACGRKQGLMNLEKEQLFEWMALVNFCLMHLRLSC